MREPRLLLNDILESITLIETYTTEGYDAFLENRMMQDAVVRNLEVIGEATKQLPPSLRQSYSAVPWKRIAGLRDILIHDYVRINLNEIWQVVERDLSNLKVNVTAILQELSQS